MKPTSILFFLLLLSHQAAIGSVLLTVKETADLTRQDDPVSYGIPFAKSSNITTTNNFKITTDEAGKNTLDAQFRVLSRYNDTPNGTGPIRSVLIDFQNTISPKDTEFFYLHTDNGSGNAPGTLAMYTENNVIIDTGVMVATIAKEISWFSSVLIDSDGDGNLDDQLLGTTTTDGFLVRSTKDEDYTTWNETGTLSIEENGPLRCVIKATGYFKNTNGDKLVPMNADNGLEYTLRFTFFRNKKYSKVAVTLRNENRAWTNSKDSYPTHPAYIDYAYLKLTSAVDNTSETVDFGGSTSSGLASYSIHMAETSDGSAQSYTWEQSINGGGTTSDQFESYADVRDSSIGIMAGMRWFWQQHPKAYRFEGGGHELYIDLWPNETANHTLPGGLWKTHEMILYFHDNSDSDFDNVMATLQNRLIARPDDIYIAETNFFYSIPPENIPTSYSFNASEPTLSDVIAQDNKLHRAKIDAAYIENATYPNSIKELRSNRLIAGPGPPNWWTWYGWLEFGDFPRWSASWGYSANHYDWSYSTLVSWLRFEDYDYLNIAEEIVSHQADVSIMHDQNALTNKTWGSKYHGGHRYEQDALLSPYDTYSVSEKNAPATGSHFWSKGIALQYLLTGDFRYLDALEDTVEGRIYNYFTNIDCTVDCSGNGYTIREIGRSLEGLITGYIVFGNSDYLTKASLIHENALMTNARTWGDGEYFETLVGDRDASLLQSGTTIEPLIHLYSCLVDKGDTLNANKVKNTLFKQGIWYRDSVYPNWNCANGNPGDYIGNDYIPYGQCKEWDKDATWVCGNCSTTDSGYFFGRKYAIDLFAFLYKVGFGIEWLNLGRSVLKDEIVYGVDNVDQISIGTSVRNTKGWNNSVGSGDSWAKDGQLLKKGLYYMHAEWESYNVPVIFDIKENE